MDLWDMQQPAGCGYVMENLPSKFSRSAVLAEQMRTALHQIFTHEELIPVGDLLEYLISERQISRQRKRGRRSSAEQQEQLQCLQQFQFPTSTQAEEPQDLSPVDMSPTSDKKRVHWDQDHPVHVHFVTIEDEQQPEGEPTTPRHESRERHSSHRRHKHSSSSSRPSRSSSTKKYVHLEQRTSIVDHPAEIVRSLSSALGSVGTALSSTIEEPVLTPVHLAALAYSQSSSGIFG